MIEKIYKNTLWVGIIIILLKLFIIDIDLPKWDIAFYQPIDELYYSYSAISLYKHGTIFPANEYYGGWGTPILTNIASYIGLSIFGNNYLGFRIGSVFFALITTIFFYHILNRLTDKKILVFFGVLLLVFNYPFTLSNIVVEPTIARMATMMIAIFMTLTWYQKGEDKNSTSKVVNKYANLVTLSFCTTLLWLFIYPTNAFLLLGLFFVFLLKSKEIYGNNIHQLITKILLPSSFGILLGILVYVVFVLLVFGSLGLDRSENYGNRVGFTFIQVLHNIYNLLKSNIFIFNPALLFALCASMYFLLTHKTSRKGIAVVLCFIIAFLIQSAFLNDFPQRKLIILLPLGILMIMYNFSLIQQHYNKHLFLCISLLSAIVIGVIYYNVFPTHKSGIFLYFSWSLYALFTLLFIYVCIKNINKKYLVFFIPILLSISNTIFFSLSPITKHYKHAMQKLSATQDRDYIGGISVGFSLYNENSMWINPYFYYGKNEEYWRLVKDISSNTTNSKVYLIATENETNNLERQGFSKKTILMKKDNTVYLHDILVFERDK